MFFEYGTSRAAAWDCPVTMQASRMAFASNPRTKDNFEVLRRWEDVRQKGWLSAEQKKQLQNLEQEHILLINEEQEYELVPYYRIEGAASGNLHITAYAFERNDKAYVVCWHKTGSGKMKLDINNKAIVCEKELGGERIPIEESQGYKIIPISGRCYLSCACSKEELIAYINEAEMMDIN